MVVFNEKLYGALVTAAPTLVPSTLNCTPVVFVDALVVIVMVPVTVAPVAGEVIEIVGAELFTWGLVVTLAQPAQSSPKTKRKHNHGAGLSWAVDLPMSSVRKLIESFL